MILNKDFNLPETVQAQIDEVMEDVSKFDERDFDEAETYVEFLKMVDELATFISKSKQVIQSAMKQGVPFEHFMGAIGLSKEEEAE